MYLKKLELQGFKSFAAKTSFEFGPGITAIVGPNGSGKSNVAESIRWVLGEQSARNVRARRLEDIIFTGSSQKAAVGMAEVAITMDNSEGWLPVDYSEVVVSRRAYRSGESEYLINRSKVRLRDVMDLFLRAQVGQNSYAFMGQGLVDEVLVMRPEERRRLLEEAADVRLLRTRLDEARDRLAATRENLDRVNLLIEEIAPRLAQLERQASRAAEHGKLARELQETLQALYSRQWLAAQAALTAASEALAARQADLEASQQQADGADAALTSLGSELETLREALSERRVRHRDLSDEVHALEQRLLLENERRENQLRRRAELLAEIESLKEERTDLQHSAESEQERSLAIVPEIEDAKGLIATRRQELNALEQEQGSLRRRIADSEDVVNRAKRGIAEAEATLKRMADDEARSRGELDKQSAQKRDLVEQILSTRREFTVLREQLAVVQRDLDDAEQERIGLNAMVESSRNDLRALENEGLQIDSRLRQLEAREELLRRLQNAQEGVDDGVRFLLGEGDAQSQLVEGLVGLVRDIVRVPPGLERAIEAALAENLQALVFENTNMALAALDMLEQREQGRALLYPLDALRSAPPININREKGVVGVAARLVRCENQFRPLVDALLGRVIVVEGVRLAREMLRRGLGSVVTTDGYLLRPNGAMSGGISRAAAESFTRQRELDDLPGQIAAAASRKEEAEYRVMREREALEGATAALSLVEPALQKSRDERQRIQQAIVENRGRLILLRTEARALRRELRNVDGAGDSPGRKVRLAREIEAFEAELQKAEDILRRDRQAMTALTTRRNRAIDAVSEAVAAHANLEGEARSLSRQLEVLQASVARLDARLKDREDTIKAIDREAGGLAKRDDAEAQGLAAKAQELAALAAELEPAEAGLVKLASREREMQHELATARTKLLDAERRYLEAEAAATLRGEELEVLRESVSAEGFDTEGMSPEHNRTPDAGAEVDVDELRQRVTSLRNKIRSLGPVNEQAQTDYGESKERHDFLRAQVDDLTGSEHTLLGGIDELETNIRERLTETFAVVDASFSKNFESFFGGGVAKLVLTQADDMASTGIDISAQPPGKRVNSLAMLSGGERTLTALALLMALLEANPSPMCVLDEVDAALDETNVGRFVDAIKTLGERTQFIIITHNPRTIEAADAIYGVSMGSDSTSQVLSVKLADAASVS
jgi:chromosome segregation protein